MKRFMCIVSICLVSVFLLVSASADSELHSVNRNVVQSLIESSLENGLSPHKDIQLMLNNALANGYDYVNVINNEDAGNFVVEVAIDGLASALHSLEKDGSDESLNILMQARDTIISQNDTILSLLDMVGRNDIRITFKLLDDSILRESGYSFHLICIMNFSDGRKTILPNIEAWRNHQ